MLAKYVAPLRASSASFPWLARDWHAWITTSTRPAQVAPMSVARREVEILGSFIYYAGEFAIGIRLIAERVVDAEALVGLVVGLDETEAAFKAVESGAVAKAIVEP